MRFLSWLRRPRRQGSLPTPSPFTRHWLLGQCALLFVLLATFVLAAFQVHRYEDGVTRSTFIVGGSPPVPVLRFTPASTALNIVAVIAHGYSADKELMSAFAVDLAKQGIVAYLRLSWPWRFQCPYGGANGKGVIKQLTTTLSRVVDYAVAHSPSSQHARRPSRLFARYDSRQRVCLTASAHDQPGGDSARRWYCRRPSHTQ